jgi:hypothetical protein
MRRSTMSKSISIQLLEPIIFVGSNLETSPPVIRGTVNMNLVKNCVVNKLHVDFKGIMKTQWNSSKFTLFYYNLISNSFVYFKRWQIYE